MLTLVLFVALSVTLGVSGAPAFQTNSADLASSASSSQTPTTRIVLTLSAPAVTGEQGTATANVRVPPGTIGTVELVTTPVGAAEIVGSPARSWHLSSAQLSLPVEFRLSQDGVASIEVSAVVRSASGEIVGAHGAALSLHHLDGINYVGVDGSAALARDVFDTAVAPTVAGADRVGAEAAFQASLTETTVTRSNRSTTGTDDDRIDIQQTPTVRVFGEVAWFERPRAEGVASVRRPAASMLVQVTNADGALLGVATTNEEGLYSVTVGATVDRIRVVISTLGSGFSVLVPEREGDPDPLPVPHRLTSELISITDATEIQVTLNAASGSEMNAAIAIHQAVTKAAPALEVIPGISFPAGQFVFPVPGKSLYAPDTAQVRISLHDAFDWDVVLHELAHKLGRALGIDDSPGGPHDLADNLADILPKDEALRLAWSEGFATVFSLASQQLAGLDQLGIAFVGDTSYTDWEPVGSEFRGFTYNAEASEPGSNAEAAGLGLRGAAEEAGVIRALWDLYDAADEEGDTVALGPELFARLSVSSATDFFAAWKAIVANQSPDVRAGAGCVASQVGAAATPTILSPPGEDGVSAPVIAWSPGGMGDALPHTAFSVQVLDEELTPLFGPVENGPFLRWTPTDQQWAAMREAGVAHVQVIATHEPLPSSAPIAGCPLRIETTPPTPDVRIETACLAQNGRIDAVITNDTAISQSIEFQVGQLTPRTRVVAPGETEVLTITGRGDGPITVTVTANGQLVAATNVVISCDPLPADQPEVRIAKSCLGGNGRIDVHLTNPLVDSAAVYAVFVDSIPPKTTTLNPGRTVRVSTTGRPDGLRPVRVTRNGLEVADERVSIACDIDPDGREVVVLDSCLLGLGRFDIYLTNPGAVTATYTVQVSGLTDRTVEVAPGDTVREAVTGRRDGSYTIGVRRAGVLIASEERIIAC